MFRSPVSRLAVQGVSYGWVPGLGWHRFDRFVCSTILRNYPSNPAKLSSAKEKQPDSGMTKLMDVSTPIWPSFPLAPQSSYCKILRSVYLWVRNYVSDVPATGRARRRDSRNSLPTNIHFSVCPWKRGREHTLSFFYKRQSGLITSCVSKKIPEFD